MMTFDDMGEGGGQHIMTSSKRKMFDIITKGGSKIMTHNNKERGVKFSQNRGDVICGWSLI